MNSSQSRAASFDFSNLSLVPMEGEPKAEPKAVESFPYGRQAVTGQRDADWSHVGKHH